MKFSRVSSVGYTTVQFASGLEISLRDPKLFDPKLLEESTGTIQKYQGSLDLVIDVGAHVGAISCTAAKKGAKLVLAFEPDWDNFRLLCQNIQQNGFVGKIVPFQMAVAPKSMELRSLKNVDKHGGSSGQRSLLYTGNVDGEQPVVTFGFFDLMVWVLKTWEYVDYLKIDIEGGEWDLFNQQSQEVRGILQWVKFLDLSTHPLVGHQLSPFFFKEQQQLENPPTKKKLRSFLQDNGFDEAKGNLHLEGVDEELESLGTDRGEVKNG